jgi:hypothetical protein
MCFVCGKDTFSQKLTQLHYFRQSGEIVFLDATGNCDKNNMRVFLLMTVTKAGGIPLGAYATIVPVSLAKAVFALSFSIWRQYL